jgi:outer membrane receptor for ferrienterochelin and colicin
LRGLGGDRTLTLVNGRRHVAGFRGSQACRHWHDSSGPGP